MEKKIKSFDEFSLNEKKSYECKYSIEDGDGDGPKDWKRYIDRAKIPGVKAVLGSSAYKHHKSIIITAPTKDAVKKIIKALANYGAELEMAYFDEVNESKVNELRTEGFRAWNIPDSKRDEYFKFKEKIDDAAHGHVNASGWDAGSDPIVTISDISVFSEQNQKAIENFMKRIGAKDIADSYFEENESKVDEGTRKNYTREGFGKYPYAIYFSDHNMRDAIGGDSVQELIDNVAKKRNLETFEIFKQDKGFHSTTQDEYLQVWYDKTNSGFWSNMSKENPELKKKEIKKLSGWAKSTDVDRVKIPGLMDNKGNIVK